MNVTVEQVKKLKESYMANKKDLKNVKDFILEYGCTNDGLTDETESFEQGWNNALEYVFSVLDVKPKTIEELKNENKYEFECNLTEEYKNENCIDEWGCAFVWLGDIGVEYNFCIDGGNNSCAIYKTEMNKEDDYMETDYSTCNHYEIDFNNHNWKTELENAMCKTLIEFFDL